ncbi:hypothetical protein [Desulfolutivibrio sp.]|uniref:hypothetical protein n=1 Tax=Desulfolutivibrio sp. TaxID=2773296 RepID=UPI002F96AC01
MTARRITADMSLLDVVAAHPATEAVFRSRDAAAGACLLCTALFDSIDVVAARHGLDLEALLGELENAAAGGSGAVG